MSKLRVEELSLPGLRLLTAPVAVDERGAFAELFSVRDFAHAGIGESFVQDNFVRSEKAGTLRGLHYQRPPHAQGKLVRVMRGRIWDVTVDLRAGAPTYGQWCGVELGAETGESLYIPPGFAHGYCTLEDDSEVYYKVTDFYAPASEGGIVWNDPGLAIDWRVSGNVPELSDKDKVLPSFADHQPVFAFED